MLTASSMIPDADEDADKANPLQVCRQRSLTGLVCSVCIFVRGLSLVS